MPLSTLRLKPRGVNRKTQGQDGVRFLLSCKALSSSTTCRFIPAHPQTVFELMTFWLTVIVLDYCESPSDEPGGKARRGPHTVSRRKLLAPLAASRRCEFSRRNALQSRLPTVRRRQRAGRLAPGGPLSRTAQPRKLGVQDGDGFGGGFPGCQAERDRGEGRGHAGPPGPLVAGIGSAAARSQSACLL